MYFTDRGLEELADRRGEEQVTLAWLADQLQAFVDQHPDFEVPVERLATWLARGGTDDVDDDRRSSRTTLLPGRTPSLSPLASSGGASGRGHPTLAAGTPQAGPPRPPRAPRRPQ